METDMYECNVVKNFTMEIGIYKFLFGKLIVPLDYMVV